MEQTRNLIELLDRPAFCVKDGIITYQNPAAAQYCLTEGQEIWPLLGSDVQSYQEYTDGVLYVTVTIAGIQTGAAIVRMDECDIFLPETEYSAQGVQCLALAAQHLRSQLGTVMATVQSEFPDNSGRLNRGLYKLQRMVCNMSDLCRYRTTPPAMELMDVGSAVYEIIQKASVLLENGSVKLLYTGSNEPMLALANYEMLERAVYNLLSNAIKFSGSEATLNIQLAKKSKMLLFTIEDNGSGVNTSLYTSIFNRYLRQPAIEDGLHGIGLGMALVQAVAAAHGGTVLISTGKSGGTKITLTIATQTGVSSVVRSPIIRPYDYCGGHDHGLLELSDVADPKHYISQ